MPSIQVSSILGKILPYSLGELSFSILNFLPFTIFAGPFFSKLALGGAENSGT